MGINSHFTCILSDPEIENQLQQNAGLSLDENLIMLLNPIMELKHDSRVWSKVRILSFVFSDF